MKFWDESEEHEDWLWLKEKRKPLKPWGGWKNLQKTKDKRLGLDSFLNIRLSPYLLK